MQLCVHCGRFMGDLDGGFASYNTEPLCHPNAPDRPNCYEMVTVQGHDLYNCPMCMWIDDEQS